MKVVINRREKSITTSVIINIGRRKRSYFAFTVRSQYLRGSSVREFYLSEKIVHADSLKIRYRDCIRFDEEDFLSGLEEYLFYEGEQRMAGSLQSQHIEAFMPTTDDGSGRLRRAGVYYRKFNNSNLCREDISMTISKLHYKNDKDNRDRLVKAQAHELNANLYIDDSDWAAARREIEHALTEISHIEDMNQAGYFDLLSKLGNLHLISKDYDDAEKCFMKAFDGFGEPEDAYKLHVVHLASGDIVKAEKYIIEAFEVFFEIKYLTAACDFLLAVGKRDRAGKLLAEAEEDMDQDEHELYDHYKKSLRSRTVTVEELIEQHQSEIQASIGQLMRVEVL